MQSMLGGESLLAGTAAVKLLPQRTQLRLRDVPGSPLAFKRVWHFGHVKTIWIGKTTSAKAMLRTQQDEKH